MLGSLDFVGFIAIFCMMWVFIFEIVYGLERAKSHISVWDVKSALLIGVMVLQSPLDLGFQCTTKLDCRRCPVIERYLLLFVPNVCTAKQNVTCFCREATWMILPIIPEYPFFKISFKSCCVATYLYILLDGATHAEKDVATQLFCCIFITALFCLA